MQISKYMKVYPAEPGRVILFSTKKTSKVELSEETFTAMKEGKLLPQIEKTLADTGFLVKDRNEEQKEMQQLIERVNKNRKICNIVIVLNLDCNLDCIYCFEGTQKGKKYMSPKMADEIIDFLVARSYEKGKSLNVSFYGGEPLMSFKLIKYISKKLHERSGDLQFTSNMTTNGLMLTRKRVKELLPYGFQGAKVTVDGDRDNHDKYRPLVSGGRSFHRIIKNIKNTYDLIDISLGGNYAEDNYRDFPKLLETLIEKGIEPKKLKSVTFVPITKTHDEYIIPEYQDVGCEANYEPWVSVAAPFLREESLKRGFHVNKIKPGLCPVEYNDDMVINYDGSCFKCPAFIGHDNLQIGSISEGIKDYSKTYALDNWKSKDQDCKSCVYLPICFGGCRFMTYLRDGNMNDVDCRKKLFDDTLEGVIKQDMKYIKQIRS